MVIDVTFGYKAYNGQPLFLDQECIEVRDREIKRIKAQLVPHKVNLQHIRITCTLSLLCTCTFVCSNNYTVSQVTSSPCTYMCFHTVSMLGAGHTYGALSIV